MIDSAPILPFADCRALSNLTDGLIFVGRSGITTRELVQRSLELLDQVHSAPVLQFVVNAADVKSLPISVLSVRLRLLRARNQGRLGLIRYFHFKSSAIREGLAREQATAVSHTASGTDDVTDKCRKAKSLSRSCTAVGEGLDHRPSILGRKTDVVLHCVRRQADIEKYDPDSQWPLPSMWFDTPAYAFFLILVVAVYWRLGRRNQNIFLLAASYFFYGWWDYRFLLLMIGSTTIDFLIARAIERTSNTSTRRNLLVASLIVNFAILGFFKYFNFFVDSFIHVLATAGVHASAPLLRIILPPGISFYTFQEVAYIVDVYKKKLPAARSFVEYALFISLFPHLIAGPIQRPNHLLPQVQGERTFDSDKFFNGLLLILSGLFRKCVIADNCALLANAAFSGGFGEPNLCVLAIGTLRLRLANLRGLQRVQRHRPGQRPVARLSFHGQLPAALSGDFYTGFLA